MALGLRQLSDRASIATPRQGTPSQEWETRRKKKILVAQIDILLPFVRMMTAK
jgi:hypothetical protein